MKFSITSLICVSFVLMSLGAAAAPAKNRKAKTPPPPPVELSTRKNAEQEIREAELAPPARTNPNKSSKPATMDAAATTNTLTDVNPLQLQDSYIRQERLSYWSTSLSLERYAPVGRGSIVGGNQYSLNQVSSTWLPTLSAGYHFAPLFVGSSFLSPSVEGAISYMTQPLEVETASQSRVSGQLNTTRFALKPRVLVGWPVSARIFPRVGVEIGQLYTSYSADSSLARWTESINYFGYSAGLMLKMTSKWQAFTDFSERKRLEEDKDSPLDLQARAVEMGVSYIW